MVHPPPGLTVEQTSEPAYLILESIAGVLAYNNQHRHAKHEAAPAKVE